MMLFITYFASAELDFRFPVGAPIHGIRAFLTTNQLNVHCEFYYDVYVGCMPLSSVYFSTEVHLLFMCRLMIKLEMLLLLH